MISAEPLDSAEIIRTLLPGTSTAQARFTLDVL
jgi:hypothetical protein